MTPWIVGYLAALALALAFNRGAHRKPSPRPVPRTPTLLPDAGNTVTVFVDYSPMGNWAEQADGAEVTWEGE